MTVRRSTRGSADTTRGPPTMPMMLVAVTSCPADPLGDAEVGCDRREQARRQELARHEREDAEAEGDDTRAHAALRGPGASAAGAASTGECEMALVLAVFVDMSLLQVDLQPLGTTARTRPFVVGTRRIVRLRRPNAAVKRPSPAPGVRRASAWSPSRCCSPAEAAHGRTCCGCPTRSPASSPRSTMPALIFERPRSRSTKVTGTSTTDESGLARVPEHVDLEPVAAGVHVVEPDASQGLGAERPVAGGRVPRGQAQHPSRVRAAAAREPLAAARPVLDRAAVDPARPDDEVDRGSPAASAALERVEQLGSCSGWCEPSASICTIGSKPSASAQANASRYAAPRPCFSVRCSTCTEASAAAISSASTPVPSGEQSSTTSTLGRGNGGAHPGHDRSDVLALVVGGYHHQGSGHHSNRSRPRVLFVSGAVVAPRLSARRP